MFTTEVDHVYGGFSRTP